jgi:ABC-type lipoprotein release transport system permease subunit
VILGVFNIGASLWMIILEKAREFGILQSMGLTKSQVRELFYRHILRGYRKNQSLLKM